MAKSLTLLAAFNAATMTEDAGTRSYAKALLRLRCCRKVAWLAGPGSSGHRQGVRSSRGAPMGRGRAHLELEDVLDRLEFLLEPARGECPLAIESVRWRRVARRCAVVVAVWHESGGFSASGMICSHPSKHLKTTTRKGASPQLQTKKETGRRKTHREVNSSNVSSWWAALLTVVLKLARPVPATKTGATTLARAASGWRKGFARKKVDEAPRAATRSIVEEDMVCRLEGIPCRYIYRFVVSRRGERSSHRAVGGELSSDDIFVFLLGFEV